MLKLSGDRKTTFAANKQNATVKNTFGLPAGISCPGATSICDRVCYAKKLERMPYLKSVRDLLAHNWALLSNASFSEQVAMLEKLIDNFRAQFVNSKADVEKAFRIHWDGDFFSTTYAHAWARVIDRNPDIQFWAYTRSFTPALNVVPILAGLENLSLYLSIDAENLSLATPLLARYPSLRGAALAQTAAEAKEMLSDRTTACPEVIGKLPLIVTKRNGKRVGACAACTLCVRGTANVAFSISKE